MEKELSGQVLSVNIAKSLEHTIIRKKKKRLIFLEKTSTYLTDILHII